MDPSLYAAAAPKNLHHHPSQNPLIGSLVQRVTDLEKVIHSIQMEKSAASSSSPICASRKKFPYSALEKHPEVPYEFHMPLHYPKYSKTDYETMPEWQINRLLEEYGVPPTGSLSDKRSFAIGAFLWGDEM